ncbi:unnamed protein product, partial [Pelagomonas calceolata]
PGGRTPRGRSPAAAAARRAWRSRRVAPRWLSCLRVPCSVWAFVAAAAARPAPCRALLWLGVAWLLSESYRCLDAAWLHNGCRRRNPRALEARG